MSERKGRHRRHEPRRNHERRDTQQRLHRRSTRPPRLAQALLALRSAPESREFALGDMAQEYAEHRAERGWMMARAWYWWQAVRSLIGAHGMPGPGRHDKDVHRRRGAVLEVVGRDVLLALRSFARSPLFTAAAIVTLALGIGATTAVFSLADAVLFREIPGIEAPENVATVMGCGEFPDRPGACLVSGLSYPNLRDVASRLRTASGLGGENGAVDVAVVVGDATPVTLDPRYVSDSYFDVLGMQPQLGRTFTRDEDDPAAVAPVAVISYRLWANLFQRSPDILGQEMLINGKSFTVIGVAARGFRGTSRAGRGDDLWLPGGTMLWVNEWEGDMSDRATVRDFSYMVIRREPGMSWEQVEGELDSVSDWLAERYPDANAKFRSIDFRVTADIGAVPGQAVTMMSVLLAVVGLILLIACTNVSTLLLIKGLRRQGEAAVRKALGASTGRLLGQHLTESVTLWLLGGAAGTGLALVAVRLMDRNVPELSGMLMLEGEAGEGIFG